MAKKSTNKLKGVIVEVQSPRPETDYQSAESKARERRYRAEDDLRTITRYNEICKDPERIREVKKLATEQMKTLQHATSMKKI